MSQNGECASCYADLGDAGAEVFECHRCNRAVCEFCFEDAVNACRDCTDDDDICLLCGIANGVQPCERCGIAMCRRCRPKSYKDQPVCKRCRRAPNLKCSVCSKINRLPGLKRCAVCKVQNHSQCMLKMIKMQNYLPFVLFACATPACAMKAKCIWCGMINTRSATCTCIGASDTKKLQRIARRREIVRKFIEAAREALQKRGMPNEIADMITAMAIRQTGIRKLEKWKVF